MKIIKNIFLFFLIFYLSGFSNRSNNFKLINDDYIPKEMQISEDITYVVKFGFIRLGEVRLMILEKKEKSGQILYKTKAFIDSYSGIPFVSIHHIYESSFNSKQ